MSNRIVSRPDATTVRKLGIALFVVALVAGAGCAAVGLGGSDGGGSGGADLIEYVPQDQNVVMEFDVAVTQDDATQQLLQAGEDQDEAPADQSDLQSSLDEFEAQTGLDPTGFEAAMVYGQTGGVSSVEGASSQEDAGVLIDSSWSADELRSAIRSNESTSLEEVEYSESGVFYEIVTEGATSEQDTYLGVHGDGVFVVGTEGPVRNSLDVTYDGASALDGTLREAYDDTRDGYVTFAMTMPETNASGTTAAVGEQIDAMTGVYYTDGDTVGLEGRIKTASEQTAGVLNMTVQSQLSGFLGGSESAELLQHLEIEAQGSDLVVTYESDVETLVDASESGN